MIMESGRVCMKVRGKDAGKYCVIFDKIDKNFVKVDGKGIKRGKVNLSHLEPLPIVFKKITKSSRTETIIKKLEKELS